MVTYFEALLDAGGVQASKTLDIGLRKVDDQGQAGALMRGSEELFARLPVSLMVSVPGGAWQLAAVPKSGWPSGGALDSPLFLIGLVNSFFAAAFIWWLVSLPHRERLRNVALRREMAERSRAEEELRLSEQKYASLFQLMPDMVGITRMADGTFLEVNAGFTAITGWEKNEVVGRTSVAIGLWTPEARAGAVAHC